MSSNQPRSLNLLRQRQRLLQLGLFSLVTIIIWVGFSLMRSQKDTAISKELQDLAAPLTPTVNTEVVNEIEAKKAFTAAELRQFPIYKLLVENRTGEKRIVTIETPDEPEAVTRAQPSPSPEATPTPVSTPSASPASSASPSGEVLPGSI